MNAIFPMPPETDAEATARHLRMCREMAELGMQLADAAFREAQRNLVALIEHPMPGAALPPACRSADPGLLFSRATRSVRQTIALEIRIRTGRMHAPRPIPPQTHPTTDATPRPGHSDFHAAFRTDADEALDDELDDRPAPEILATIREVLGIPALPTRLTPDLRPPLRPD